MVTQLYTAPLKPYKTAALQAGKTSAAPTPDLTAAQEDKEQGSEKTLAVLQEQSLKGTISIDAVLTDFQSTMEALGVKNSVREEIAPYLQVIAHQAQRPQPSIGLIKQNLRVSAETLDQFISSTLGQNSHVVREWVDALLLQPIEFSTDKTIRIPRFENTATEAKTVLEDDLPPPESETGLSPETQASLKEGLEQAKAATKAKSYDTALNHYQALLDDLNGTSPVLEARILYHMGRLHEKRGAPADAKGLYQKANALLANHKSPTLQARLNQSLGLLSLRDGELDNASDQTRQALAYAQDTHNTHWEGQLLAQMGRIQLQQGSWQMAKDSFLSALDKTQAKNPKLAQHLLRHLAAMARKEGQFKQAFGYYKEALERAQAFNKPRAVQKNLQQMASLYLDANQPDKALSVLQVAVGSA